MRPDSGTDLRGSAGRFAAATFPLQDSVNCVNLRARILAVLSLISATLLSAPAQGCSVGNDYRVPTNMELVERADTILIARVTGGIAVPDANGSEGDAESDDPEDWFITLDPLVTIKGAAADGPLALYGVALAPERFALPSNPYDLTSAHPLAYIGGCIRYLFQPGRTVLFILSREDGALVPFASPFSRWAEDVPDEDAPWARAVRLYAEIAALPEAERMAALRDRSAALRAVAAVDDPDALLIARDVDRQLTGPNRPWNAMMAEQMGYLSDDDAGTDEPAAE